MTEHSERLMQLQAHFEIKSAEADEECFTREKYGFLERRLHSMIADDQVPRSPRVKMSHESSRVNASHDES